MRRAARCLALAAVAAVCGLLIRNFAFFTARVVGDSMNGALQSGDVVLVSRLAWRLGEPARGDVALARAGGAQLIKRIVGLPGEDVALSGGRLYLGGRPADEPYLPGDAGDGYERTMGPAEYLLLGDNRHHSHDSRAADVGPAARADLVGKVVWILWPPERAGIVE
ncbi:MAG: signal peptidase I [Clostridiales bacterium]|nr:signal peptidase I [Clostridiales bacterium]